MPLVAMREFDRKFGPDLLRQLPAAPAVYLFTDASGTVLYAGKAKNVRRRLASYRAASRRKVHRKMRLLIREACAVDVRPQPSEADALRLEHELIRTLRPRYNVEGAFDFLYPAIGSGQCDGRLLLCFTTQPEAFAALDLQWHGSFRPRRRALEAFDALATLLSYVGHREPRSRLPAAPRLRGGRLLAWRRMPPDLLEGLRGFLDGQGPELLPALSLRLLESLRARRDSHQVQQAIRCLEGFYRREVLGLRRARECSARSACFVPREQRDALFLEARLQRAAARRPQALVVSPP
jgi:predicted GIY-YIG superfamily endonuclease